MFDSCREIGVFGLGQRSVCLFAAERYNLPVVLANSVVSQWSRWRRKSWRLLRSAPAYLLHPKGVTCLECGFLASEDFEVRTSDRVLLAASGEGGCPPLNKLHCLRKLWVNYELGNWDNSRDGLFEEVQKKRRPCPGFLQYRTGWSPTEHRVLLQNKLELRDKIFISAASAIGAAVLALAGDWLLKWLGLK